MQGNRQLLQLETRRRIYEHVRRVPGLHLRQIQRDLEMPMGTLEYHLHQMEKGGLLVTREDGRFKAFYPNEHLDRRDRDFLYYLRQEMPRRIALEVVDQPGISFQELVQRLPIGASTLSFHLKKLRAGSLVEERRRGQKKCYEPTDPERIRRIIVRYRTTFVDEVVDRFAEAWLDLSP
jgi:predicted transcriptional regulator